MANENERYLEESKCHASTNDKLVNLVQHVVDQLDLVSNLGSTQDGQEGPWRVVQGLVEVCQLLLQEETRSSVKELSKQVTKKCYRVQNCMALYFKPVQMLRISNVRACAICNLRNWILYLSIWIDSHFV